jgi:hypothetical protein
MKTVVIYDASTGAVKGSLTFTHVADVDAAIEANTPEGMQALKVASSHPVNSDHAGWTVQNGELVEVTLSDSQLIEQEKTSKLANLERSYSEAKAANVSYMDTEFMTDTDSQQLFSHALLAYQAIGATPEGFFTVDASYNKVPMDLSQLKGLVEAIAAQVWAVFQRWVAVREELAAATTITDVQSITW